jgi:RHS repeat-associated protein
LGRSASNQDKEIATQGSSHEAVATAPDLCRVPGVPPPVPFPNHVPSARLSAGATVRTTIGGAPIWTSAGQLGPPSEPAHAGVGGGVQSGTYRAEAKAITYSRDVLAEGNPVVRTGDRTTHNHGNTVGLVVAGGAGAFAGAPAAAAHAPVGAPDSAFASDPVDVVTGRTFTLPAVDLRLEGPLPLVFERLYSSRAAGRDVGLGHGWVHSFAWEIEPRDEGLRLWTDDGIPLDLDDPPLDGRPGAVRWGFTLQRAGRALELRSAGGLVRVFEEAPRTPGRHRLVAIADLSGNRIALHHEGARLAEIRDAAGRTVILRATDGGRIGSIELAGAGDGPQAVYRYDDRGDLVSVTDAEGFAARYRYHADHLLVERTDRAGLTFHFRYDGLQRCEEAWGETRDPEGRVLPDLSLAEGLPRVLADGLTPARGVHHVKLSYHDDASTECADALAVRRHVANARGTLDHTVEPSGVTARTYDDAGRLASRVEPDGATTTYGRDRDGEVIEVEDPLGRAMRIARDAEGRPIACADPEGRVTRLAWDDAGRLAAVTDPAGGTWRAERDGRGLVGRMILPNGAVWTLEHDGAGNLASITQPDGGRWRWEHDAYGRVISRTDPLGRARRYGRSRRGDVIAVTDEAGATTRATFDGEQRAVLRIDAVGAERAIGWGGFGRLAWVRDELGRTTALRYDREGNLVAIHNAREEVHRLAYDAGGGIVGETAFDGATRRAQRDAAGRITRLVAEDGRASTLDHDLAGQLVAIRSPGGRSATFEHDRCGALARAREGSIEAAFARDALGRVRRDAQTVDGEEHWVEIAYDALGEVVARRTSLGYEERVERDSMGRRTRTILGAEGGAIVHERDALGREIARDLPGGGRLERRFEPAGRVGVLRAEGPGGARAEVVYRYDARGRLAESRDSARGRTRYAHDATGRLVAREREAGVAERFSYDATGNLAREGELREHGPGDRLLRLGDVAYEWDARGRLAARRGPAGVLRCSWSDRDRLESVTLLDGTRVELDYDPLTRRLRKRVYRPAADGRTELSSVTRYVWDRDVIVHEITRDAAGALLRERTYVFEDDPFVPLAHRDAGSGRGARWLHYANDPAGAPDRLLSPDGAVAVTIERGAFGSSGAAGDAGTALRFQGQIEDEETGLFYNRLRYYDPEAARYIAKDPLGPIGGLNEYAYVGDPTGEIDPLGTQVLNLIELPDAVTHTTGAPFTVGQNAYLVMVHGSPYGFYSAIPVLIGGQWKQNLTPEDLAYVIRSRPDYVPGTRIILYSCNTALSRGGHLAPAKRLADLLGVEVQAPAGYTNAFGAVISTYPTEPKWWQSLVSTFCIWERGPWFTFSPKTPYDPAHPGPPVPRYDPPRSLWTDDFYQEQQTLDPSAPYDPADPVVPVQWEYGRPVPLPPMKPPKPPPTVEPDLYWVPDPEGPKDPGH